jgi:hypothetical protein
LTSIFGTEFAEPYAKRVIDVIDEVPVCVISSGHLKLYERASGTPEDLADLDNLP